MGEGELGVEDIDGPFVCEGDAGGRGGCGSVGAEAESIGWRDEVDVKREDRED